ncbi:hypothetical protein GCM10010422_19650 [Streptomyces graminearus]|uniref:Uncharacterized protein n=1 Tax=Streptomyces graminearus TaxID=284030 RepID=A0ABN3L1M7_9ACTN
MAWVSCIALPTSFRPPRADARLRPPRVKAVSDTEGTEVLAWLKVADGASERILATAWIVERWPDCTNPYLIVSRRSAVDDIHP